MHNELKVFLIVLIVFVFIPEFQDKLVSEHLRVMKFHEICMLQNYIGFWNEVIYALSLTSLLIENKGALVGKCGVQRSNYFLYIIIINLYLHTSETYITVSCTIASFLVLSIGWDTCWVLDQLTVTFGHWH